MCPPPPPVVSPLTCTVPISPSLPPCPPHVHPSFSPPPPPPWSLLPWPLIPCVLQELASISVPQDQVWPVSSLELDVHTVPVNLWGLVAEVALQFGATPSMQLPRKVVSSGVFRGHKGCHLRIAVKCCFSSVCTHIADVHARSCEHSSFFGDTWDAAAFCCCCCF